jgi:uncharacterized RDD family membrane protein YckC
VSTRMKDVLGRRVIAAVIDAVLILVLLVVVAKTLGNEGATSRSIWAETQGSPRTVFFLLTFAYFVVTELVWAQTLGKRVMNLRVVTIDGGRPGAGPMLLRNVIRVVDWLPGLYIVGAIAVFMTGERRQRLGDLAAGTHVVAVTDGPPPPPDRPPPPSDDDVFASILR